jgi:uncharacterized membrane protein
LQEKPRLRGSHATNALRDRAAFAPRACDNGSTSVRAVHLRRRYVSTLAIGMVGVALVTGDPTSTILGEHTLRSAVFLLVRLVEAAGAIVIFSGSVIGFARFAWTSVVRRDLGAFNRVRLDVGRFLALGLEFQLASDLLRTAVAPSFEEIGKLAAVAAIRTALNFFLRREIREERSELTPKDETRHGTTS